MKQHLDFTAEQAEAIMIQAGSLAWQRAADTFALGIVDPMTLKAGLGPEDRCADVIDHMIRSDEGLGWSGRSEYRYNGDGFQWCGAFAAYCMPWIELELRVVYWSSTDRLNAYAQHKLLFGNSRERALAARHPKRTRAEFAAAGHPWTDAYARQFATFDEHSIVGPTAAREGDIALFGEAHDPKRDHANFRDFGQHVTLVDSVRAHPPAPPEASRWELDLYEGNATGVIPGRPETKARPVQGVIHMTRPVGLLESDPRWKYHLRRWIRPSFFDIDLDLFVRHGGILPT